MTPLGLLVFLLRDVEVVVVIDVIPKTDGEKLCLLERFKDSPRS